MTEFNKHETELFESDDEEPCWRVVFLHKPTGLLIACSSDPGLTDDDTWVPQPPGTTLNVNKHFWVHTWYCGEDINYRVERLDDLPTVLELVKGLNVDVPGSIVGSCAVVNEALLKL